MVALDGGGEDMMVTSLSSDVSWKKVLSRELDMLPHQAAEFWLFAHTDTG